MYAQVEKPKESKSVAVANAVTQKKNDLKQAFGFIDNRSEMIAQRKLHELAKNSSKIKRVDQPHPITVSRSLFSNVIQREVAKTNIEEDNDEIIGRMNYSFKWQTSEPHNNGFILQRVNRIETNAIEDGDNEVTNITYWEAWRVQDNVIFNGEVNVSGIQQDSWYNNEMNPGSNGSIEMICRVYFANTENIEGMEHDAVAMAGGLLSSEDEPGVEKTHLFDHNYNFNWDRRLQGENINRLIALEMNSTLAAFGEPDQNFDEMSEGWTADDWGDFAQSVNAHDPDNEITVENIRERI